MGNDYTYIDFDEVILETESRLFERMEYYGLTDYSDDSQFYTYFSIADKVKGEWEYIIRGSKSLNNSVEIIQELQARKAKIAVLTKVHSLREMEIKIDELKNKRKIYIPIFFVPPRTQKHELILPRNQMLIDDNSINIDGWNNNGGKGILFDHTLESDEKGKVKSLEFLLKR